MHRADESALPAAHHAEADARRALCRFASLDCHAKSPLCEAEHFAVGRIVRAGIGKIVERLFGDADDVVIDEFGTLARAVFRMLQAAFPLEYSPARVIIGGKLGEDAAEIHLPVAK